jgi:hypothetical protein
MRGRCSLTKRKTNEEALNAARKIVRDRGGLGSREVTIEEPEQVRPLQRVW